MLILIILYLSLYNKCRSVCQKCDSQKLQWRPTLPRASFPFLGNELPGKRTRLVPIAFSMHPSPRSKQNQHRLDDAMAIRLLRCTNAFFAFGFVDGFVSLARRDRLREVFGDEHSYLTDDHQEKTADTNATLSVVRQLKRQRGSPSEGQTVCCARRGRT